MKKFSWIGYDVDTHTVFFGSGARIEKLYSDLDGICAQLEFSCEGNFIYCWSSYFSGFKLRECFLNYDEVFAPCY